MLDRLQSLADRYEEVTAQMGQPDVAADYERLQELAKERASLEDIVSLYRRFRETDVEIEDARNLLEEASDPEMESLAKDELEQLNEKKERLTLDIRRALLPPDRRDEKRRDRRGTRRHGRRRGRAVRRRSLPHVLALRR